MTTSSTAEPSASAAGQTPSRATALRIALAYVLLGALWILGSGWLLHQFVQEPAMEAVLETIKGWFFVLVTGLLLALVLDRNFARLRASTLRLRQSEQRLQSALEGGKHGAWDWNAQTGEVFYSDEWKAMLGFKPEEIRPAISEWETRVHPEDLERVKSELQRHLDGGSTWYVCEHRVRRKDGSYCWILDQGRVLSRTPDGKPLRVAGTHTDITARRQAEHLGRVQHDLALALAREGNLEGGLRLCLEAAIEAAGLDCGGAYLADDRSGELRLLLHRGLSPGFVNQVSRHSSDAAATRLVMAGEPRFDRHSDPQPGWSGAEQAEGLRFRAVLPLRSEGRVLGCLIVASHLVEDVPTPIRRDLETIAAEASHAIARLKAETALRFSEERLRMAAEAAQMGTWERDLQTGFLDWSPTEQRMLGFEPGTFPGTEESFQALLHPESIPVYGEVRERARSGDGVFAAELHFRCRDGRDRWGLVRGRTFLDDQGRPERIIGVDVDITDRKRAEEALRRSELLQRTILDNMPDPAWMKDVQGRMMAVNKAWCAFTGMTADQALGRPDQELFPAAVAARLMEEDREVIQSARAARWEEAITDARGNVRVFETFKSPALDPAGRVTGTIGIARDVTERKRAERQLQRDAQRTEMLLELHQRAPQMADAELCSYVLDKAVEFTASAVGFFHQVSADQAHVVQTVWNAAVLKDGTATFRTHYPLSEAGDWVEGVHQRRAVVHNRYSGPSRQKGLPPGQAPLHRFMSLPVLQGDKVCFVVGVGNKETDYDDVDLAELQLVANELHRLMEQRTALAQVRQLSRAVEQSPTSIVITDLTGAIVYVNPRFTEVTGYTVAEVLGKNPRVLKSGDMPQDLYRQLWETISSGREWVGELQNRRKNGELFWELAFIAPITDAAGRISHYVAVKEDITERRQLDSFRQTLLSLGAELNATRRPETAARALLHALDRLMPWDAATVGVISGTPERLQNVLTVDTVNGVRQDCPALETPPDPAPWIQQVLEQKTGVLLGNDLPVPPLPTPTDTEVCRPPASVLAVPIRGEARIVGVLSVHSYRERAFSPADLQTLQALADYCGGALDRIRSEEALNRSEERYRVLVETSFDWVWEVDAQARYTYTSPRVLDLLGYSPEEVLGRTPFDFMPPDEARRVAAVFRDTAAQGVPFAALENQCRRKDGRMVVLETSGVPVLGPDGELRGYHGMDRDVTERKQLEAQLRQAQKLEAIGQLAGGVAHDFNNILAAILMHLGLLQMNTNLDEETQHALKDLDAEARRAAGLTRQLLMFSRRSVLAVKPLDMNQVVAELLKMLTRLIGEHVELQFNGSRDLPLVEADAGMMEQVLMNLVVNARDAMPRGGRITISTARKDLGPEDLHGHGNRRMGGFVCLTITDTGSGMDTATLQRIFEPFFTTKDAGKGTGLGLATVDGIVAQHKGWVEVESQVGLGTTFHVLLPAVSGPREEAPSDSKPDRVPGGHETLLIVEDEPKVRRLVAQTLRAFGYQVHEATNGREAVALWQIHGADIDLLLTDMVMPEGMTGLELVQELQALKPQLKAIVSSGYSSEIVQAGLPTRSGVVYLPKPYEVRVLAKLVRECLDKKPTPGPGG